MRRAIRLIFLSALVVLTMESGAVFGQTAAPPRLLYVTPPGGQAGSSVEVLLTGQNLDQAETLHFNFPGVKVERTGTEKAPPMIDPKTKKPIPKPPTGPLSQKFQVTLPAGAPLGIQDIRVVTKGGISNPRAFVVGAGKEFIEKEPNNDVPAGNRVELNCTVSGVINTPTDVDFFLFAGTKGQKIVVHCQTTSIDSKLPAVIELYGLSGSYLGANKSYQGNDALLDAVLPADGDYYVRVASFTYTLGGLDYFYRLTIATTPWIDAVFPAVVEPGKETEVTVYGRNLPGGQADPETKVGGRILEKVSVKVKAPADARAVQRLAYSGFIPPAGGFLDGFDFRLKNDAGFSNPFRLTLASAPVVLDNQANDSQETAQKVPVPCVIAGRIEGKADRDWYTFTAKKGQVLAIEAYGDRLGSPLDLALRVVDEKGKTIADLEDNPDTTSPQFFTRSEDPPRYRLAVPADGDYAVLVTSRYAFTEAGPRYLYVLRITPEQPDFRLVAMPTSQVTPEGVVVGQGGHQAFTVFIHRQDGFTGDITLTGENLPPGVTVTPQILPPGAKQAAIVVGAKPDAAPWAGPIKIVGTATINGQKVVREVRAATITWPVPAVTATFTRLDRELVLAVRDKAPFSLTVDKDKFTVLQGERISIPIKLTRLQPNFMAPIQVTALALPPGYAMPPVTLVPGKDSATVNIDGKPGASPGVFSVVLRGQAGAVGKKPPPPKPGINVIFQPSTPITVTIVPRQLAKLKVPTTIPKAKLGKQVEVPIELARLFDYDGPFKLELIVPPGIKGLKAGEGQIKAGETSGKLLLDIAPDANKIGAVTGLTVRVTALWGGTTPVVHESKLTVNVTK